MDPEKLRAAMLEAIKNQDGDAALKIIEQLMSGVEADDQAEDAADGGAPENADAPPVAAGETPVATSKEYAAAGAAVLMRLTGCATEAEALAKYKGMQDRVESLSQTQEAIELNTRRGLIVELIKLGVETPALAWLGATDEARAKRMPCKRLAVEPIEEMTARIATLRKVRPAAVLPPEGGGPDSADDADSVAKEIKALPLATLNRIKESGQTPEQFIAAKKAAVRRV